MEIEILGHKGKVSNLTGCLPDQFSVWIEVEEPFDDGTVGFGVLIPASRDYTQPEFIRTVKAKAEKQRIESLQRHREQNAALDKIRADQQRLNDMADSLLMKWQGS